MTGQTLVIRKILPASREAAFDAWLDAGAMRDWMCRGSVTASDVTLEPRVGGKGRIVMRGPEGRVVNTETLVAVEMHPRCAECEVVATHQRFPMEHSKLQLEQSWGGMLEKLAPRCLFNHVVGWMRRDCGGRQTRKICAIVPQLTA
ncbi:MAG TPA: SRPBCC domain-containing protein [Bryobacteraceae bacterium]|jgi:hypothetical protein